MWKFLKDYITGKIQTYKSAKIADRETTDEAIIALAYEFNGRLSADRLQRRTKMTWEKAYERLVMLQIKGVFEAEYKAEHKNAILPWLITTFVLSEEYWHEAKTLQTSSPALLTDADMIRCAMDAGGTVSAAQVCVLMYISVDAAKAKLDELTTKGVFTTHISDEGTVLYEVRDTRLLSS